MANVGNTSGSTRFEELCREITQLKDEIKNLVREDGLLNHSIGRPDFGAIEKSKKKLTDKRMKLEELEKRKEVMKETPQ
ncbi:unnamed protein product [Arabidopsis lyrata]|uniref:uncharacterized protein LOC9327668 n=1 Tax=Arabidopsis lyrata subsp. lyrata TaxID=81972 RepID=UPI000A29C321|nr:uncharacterized protein LOC9327668 [Arabidopsis lyrata subsp. lyrata]CAH8255233.1 unnamed protein product [Arabidopsis lyrata]|eukprot:XP_020870678.1 uncharacterized protein LOC9327668 [Arabidopsis lyrata subsp. lyrata]